MTARIATPRFMALHMPRIHLIELYFLARSRAALGRLDADRLRDIGLTEEEAALESTRPIWDVPNHWRR